MTLLLSPTLLRITPENGVYLSLIQFGLRACKKTFQTKNEVLDLFTIILGSQIEIEPTLTQDMIEALDKTGTGIEFGENKRILLTPYQAERLGWCEA